MVTAANSSQYSLKFLSGKCQGSDYLLPPSCDVLVGRSAAADLVLPEGTVSRLHARFALSSSELAIEDLGSTNGTFVNGQRISQRALLEGDRVLIGTSILKVVGRGTSDTASIAAIATSPNANRDTTEIGTRYDRDGGLEETSVLELLEIYGAQDREVVIELESPNGSGSMTLARGRLQACQFDGLPADASFAKRAFRIMSLSAGLYRVRAYSQPPPPLSDVSVAALLVEARHQLDEYTLLMARLPHPESAVVIPRPLVRKLSQLDELELDLLQLVHNCRRLQAVMDQWYETDLQTARRLLSLLDGGYFRRP